VAPPAADSPFTLTRLPPELGYLYLLAPLLATPLLKPSFFQMSPGQMVRETLASYIPFLAIPAGLHALYRYVMPRLVSRMEALPPRLLVHALMSGLCTALVVVLVRPVFGLVAERIPPLSQFAVRSVLITWTFILPTLVALELKARAQARDAAERRLLEEQRIALRAQLEALQSRTNPHFLFNSLNTVASLIRDDPRLAEQTVERLADLLRYALQSSRVEQVPLSRELEMLGDYLEIQRARFGERLRFGIDVEPGVGEVAVPPLLLQPLVENAILHGVGGRAEGGTVQVTARRQAGRIELRVEDDGPGPAGSAHRGSGTALADLRRRIELLYGEAGVLSIRPGVEGGFCVELLLPDGGPARVAP
jgi:two-component system sensor histidine kinase AlgZ